MKYDWIISDTHFGHAGIIKMAKRPFSSVLEMDEQMIANWNAVVKPMDRVLHLGDFAWGDARRMMAYRARLNGSISLILGNHDPLNSGLFHTMATSNGRVPMFHEVMFWEKYSDVRFTHVPLPPEELFGCVNVHGHVHDKDHRPEDRRYLNVSAEKIGYAPRSFEGMMEELFVKNREET